MHNKYIFTFWEPEENIPGYLQLCMQSWEKYMPEYKVIILNYNNLDKWLGKDYYDKSLYDNFSLPKQADAIRCAILKKYGGIWLDLDIIITSNNVHRLLENDSDFTLIEKHIGFIKADKNSSILKAWEKGCHKNIALYKMFNSKKLNIKKLFMKKLYRKTYKNLENWNFLGNFILRKPLKTKNIKVFNSLNKLEIKALPEVNYFIDNNICKTQEQNYLDFYFGNDFSDYSLKDNKGVIYLHNSWTPEKFKKMNKEEFLKQNNTLSNILNKVLD